MKKLNKISTISISIIVLISSRVFLMKEKEKVEIKDFWNREKTRIEAFIRYNYNDIDTVKFSDNGIRPTGMWYIHGIVNEDKDMYFTASGTYKSGFDDSTIISSKLSKNIKEEYKYRKKSITEIEKEKTANTKNN